MRPFVDAVRPFVDAVRPFVDAVRPFVDAVLPDVVAVAAAGVDDLRWRAPARPGDSLTVAASVVENAPRNAERGCVRSNRSRRTRVARRSTREPIR
ncbi:hypothetical protein [Halovivax sp.]|uniref:hypothetical protein n=1 Tax=Halovivax sp. TaxID=1935978 RepID=UPI0025C713E3|nr:hypothetical protein [Halovivax sp.]